jgi:hypothetical protein
MRRWTRHPLTPIVAFGVLGALLGLARWGIEPSHASGDAFWYARMALRLGGETEIAATQTAANFIVAEGRGTDPAVYVALAETIDRRYPAIFESRPIYPLVVTSFLSITELRPAMALGSLLAGVVFAAVFGSFVRYRFGSMLAAVGAVAITFALPSGKWFAFMYADGWMLALWALVLACATWYLREPRPRYLAATLAGLIGLYLTKPANGVVLVITFVLFSVGAVVLRTENRARAVTLGSSCAVVGVIQLAVFAALALPGLDSTLQDLLTSHFARPDVPDPLSRVLLMDLHLIPFALAFPFREGPALLLLVALIAPLVIVERSWAAVWVMAGRGSMLTVLVHPLTSEIPRLLAPIWVTAALGAGWWIGRIRGPCLPQSGDDGLPIECP